MGELNVPGDEIGEDGVTGVADGTGETAGWAMMSETENHQGCDKCDKLPQDAH